VGFGFNFSKTSEMLGSLLSPAYGVTVFRRKKHNAGSKFRMMEAEDLRS
jgi:hypothetical protein